MGYVKFESVEHANRVADLLGMERPNSSIIGNEISDPSLEIVKNALAMSKSIADITGEKLTINELIEQAGI